MIHARINARDEAIRTAIAAVASQVTPAGNSGWRFTLLNGAPHVVTAKADGDWLLLEADCSGAAQHPELFLGRAGAQRVVGRVREARAGGRWQPPTAC